MLVTKADLHDGSRYKRLYPRANFPNPDSELVRKGVYKCPLCGKENTADSSLFIYRDGPTLDRHWDIQGRLITTTKTTQRIPVLICPSCYFENQSGDDDERFFNISLIIFGCVWLALNIFLGIRDGSFHFLSQCLLRPFFTGLLFYFLFALFHLIVKGINKMAHPKKQDVNLKEAAKNNALF